MSQLCTLLLLHEEGRKNGGRRNGVPVALYLIEAIDAFHFPLY